MVCVLEKIKLTFFLEHSKTKSMVLPVHTYYFSKAPARSEKKGRKELEEGTCVSPCAVSSAAEKTHRSGKISVEGKRRLYRLQPHKGSNRLNV